METNNKYIIGVDIGGTTYSSVLFNETLENVIKKFINGLKKIVEKGHHLFMEAMGIEGSVTIPVPSW